MEGVFSFGSDPASCCLCDLYLRAWMDREPRGGGPASPAAPANLHEVDCGLMAGLPAERFSTWRALSFSQTEVHVQRPEGWEKRREIGSYSSNFLTGLAGAMASGDPPGSAASLERCW